MRGWKLGVLLGVAIVVWWWRWDSRRIVGLEDGQEIRLVGQVSQQPSVKVDKFTGEEYLWVWVNVGSDQFGVRMNRWSEIGYGDRAEVKGRISLISNNALRQIGR